MLLCVVADHSDNRRLGLKTLIAADSNVVTAGSRNVATRTIAASRRAVCGGERDPKPFAEEEESEGGDVEGGCWAMYGWWRRLRRLPPLIPSLRRAGSSPWALTRTRTADGRVVLSRELAPPLGRVVARRLDGRLLLHLVDSSRVHPPPRQETDVPAAKAADEEKAAIPILAPSSPPVALPVPAVACFEAVMSSSPLRKMPV